MKLYTYNEKELKFERINTKFFKLKILTAILLFFIMVSFGSKIDYKTKTKIKTIVVTEFDTTSATPENILNFIKELDIKFPKNV